MRRLVLPNFFLIVMVFSPFSLQAKEELPLLQYSFSKEGESFKVRVFADRSVELRHESGFTGETSTETYRLARSTLRKLNRLRYLRDLEKRQDEKLTGELFDGDASTEKIGRLLANPPEVQLPTLWKTRIPEPGDDGSLSRESGHRFELQGKKGELFVVQSQEVLPGQAREIVAAAEEAGVVDSSIEVLEEILRGSRLQKFARRLFGKPLSPLRQGVLERGVFEPLELEPENDVDMLLHYHSSNELSAMDFYMDQLGGFAVRVYLKEFPEEANFYFQGGASPSLVESFLEDTEALLRRPVEKGRWTNEREAFRFGIGQIVFLGKMRSPTQGQVARPLELFSVRRRPENYDEYVVKRVSAPTELLQKIQDFTTVALKNYVERESVMLPSSAEMTLSPLPVTSSGCLAILRNLFGA